MPPDLDPLDNLAPAQLARLLDIHPAPTPSWPREDPAAILLCQLAAPLLPDLLLVPGLEQPRALALIQNRPGTKSFLEQFTCPFPCLELLQAIKAFARHVRTQPDNPLAGIPADILYYAAIAAALLRCQSRITSLSDHDLHAAFLWAAAHPAAAPLAYIFTEGMATLLLSPA